jgi:hypothetical protein
MDLHLENHLVRIVIPVYKDYLDEAESLSLEQCLRVLSSYSIVVAKPESLQLNTILRKYPSLQEESFPDHYFRDLRSYNHLMLSPEFYERFLSFEYILIYQLDAYVFRDELADWCKKSYDYIGAPWIPRDRFLKEIRDAYNVLTGNHKRVPQRLIYYKVGNGGLSLRRTRSCYEILVEETALVQQYLYPKLRGRIFSPEDVFWALEPHRKNYRFAVPDYKEALLFSFDKYPETCFQITRTIPFACHAWKRSKAFSFWKEYIPFPADK